MRWGAFFMIFLACCAICLPAAGIPLPPEVSIPSGAPPLPPGLTIMADPTEAHVGDTITLNGSVTGIKTIAVYLYVTSPDLDPRGVALENLNIAAGRGLFTTAPVKMSDGTWTYEWDTSIIVGNLKPGTYSVYVVASPLDRLRSNPQETAVAQVNFTPSQNPPPGAPLSPLVPLVAFVVAGIFFSVMEMKRK